MKMRKLIKALQCGAVHRMVYDFDMMTGELHMEEGNCCDMTAAIALFMSIDPQVGHIETFSGDRMDTVYHRERNNWRAS